MIKNYCIDCGKEIIKKEAKRCRICWYKYNKGRNHSNYGKKLSDEQKEALRILNLGKNNPMYGRKGDLNPNWKGDKRRIYHNEKKTKEGYILVYVPEHPFCASDGYIFKHRLVIEMYIGRYLRPEEIVHHINGIKDDNRIENLMLFDCNSDHTKHHILLRNLEKT